MPTSLPASARAKSSLLRAMEKPRFNTSDKLSAPNSSMVSRCLAVIDCCPRLMKVWMERGGEIKTGTYFRAHEGAEITCLKPVCRKASRLCRRQDTHLRIWPNAAQGLCAGGHAGRRPGSGT